MKGVVARSLALGLIAATVSACGDTDAIDRAKPGHALSEIHGSEFGARRPGGPVAGREYALLFVPTVNESDEAVVLERVDVLGISGRDAAELISVDVAPRPQGGGGMIEITSRPRPRCRERRTFVPVEGYTVAPGEDPLLAIRIKGLSPGTFGFRSQRVFYRQGEDRYYQDMPFGVTLQVSRVAPQPSDIPCAYIDAP